MIKVDIKKASELVTVFVFGDFYVLHPGHIRFLKFAASCGDKLYVGINNSQPNPHFPTPKERLETLRSLNLKAEIFIITTGLKDVVKQLRPNILVKGKEHSKNHNEEEAWLLAWGGQLLFASGESTYFSDELLPSKTIDFDRHWNYPIEYMARHNCDERHLTAIIEDFQTKKIIVIGDLIIDEYVNCNALGMSQEDPTLVVSPQDSKKFLGGAGIVASHARSLGAKVNFISVTGNDEAAQFAQKLLNTYGVQSKLFTDSSRPTTLKQRYRVANKTMLRVSHLRQHEISRKLADQIEQVLSALIPISDALIFSDFNYGCLPQSLVIKMTALAKNHGLTIGADCQSSSQIGDISRYVGVTVMTPTEHEARLALRDNQSGLAHIGHELLDKTAADNILITLGGAGVLVVTRKPDQGIGLTTDLLPALNPVPVDTSGAGDSLLVTSTLALASKATPYQAAYLGSLAAAIQVSRDGNIPINIAELNQAVK
jgi:rfaE bifunctional protein kinase chain/domain